MNIQYQKTDNVNALLTVSLGESDYSLKYKEKLKEYGKKVQLKGFRPGHVPPAVIEKMYGTNIKADQINNMLSEGVLNYIRENKLNIIGEPLPKIKSSVDWNSQKEFEFEYELGLIPDFDPQINNNRKFEALSILITENVVKETTENLRKQFGVNVETDFVSEEDYITGTLKARDGSFEKNTMIPLNKISPEELSGFLGKGINDLVVFDIRKAFNNDSAYIAHASGATKDQAETMRGEYEMRIEKIHHQALADYNQEFYDKVFGKDAVSSLEEFNIKLKEDIERNYKTETLEFLKGKVYRNLVETVNIELPVDFLKRWMLIRNPDKVTVQTIDKDFGPFLDGLKWNLIQGKIAGEANLHVDHEEVNIRAKNMYLGYFGQMQPTPEIEDVVNKMVEKYLTEENGKNFNKLAEQIEFEKTLDYIVNKVSVSERQVSVDEFREIVSKENKKN